MNFGKTILEYKDDILKDLSTLISIQSVSGENGKECKQALDFILKKAKSFGLDTRDIEQIAGHAELKGGKTLCGVLTHLDVVPSGNNWSTMPFELTRKDGKLYGRGIADDKGAALITLYCLKALKDKGIKGKNTLRAIFGTDEERGMSDMDTYFTYEPIPDYSFTPDSEYGICKSEKGIIQLELYEDLNSATTLTQFHSGKAINAVPDTAYALFDCTENEDHQFLRLADAMDGNFEFYYTIDGMMVLSRGKSSHACHPEKGFNAATALINLMSANFYLPSMGQICSFIHTRIGMETDGNSLGIKMRDSDSGPLTLNVGTVHVQDHYATATLDIRYPVTVDPKIIISRIENAANAEGLHVKMLNHSLPINIDKDSALVKLLSEAYENVTGEKPKIYSTGGGTYARKLGGKGVGFGPIFPGEESNMHNCDECIDEEKFFLHAQICLEAMYDLYTKELNS